jgi:hypothetical protein
VRSCNLIAVLNPRFCTAFGYCKINFVCDLTCFVVSVGCVIVRVCVSSFTVRFVSNLVQVKVAFGKIICLYVKQPLDRRGLII